MFLALVLSVFSDERGEKMAYIRDKKEELTGYQAGDRYRDSVDLQ